MGQDKVIKGILQGEIFPCPSPWEPAGPHRYCTFNFSASFLLIKQQFPSHLFPVVSAVPCVTPHSVTAKHSASASVMRREKAMCKAVDTNSFPSSNGKDNSNQFKTSPPSLSSSETGTEETPLSIGCTVSSPILRAEFNFYFKQAKYIHAI